MMEQGIRHNQGKPQWSQIDFKALEPMVRVLEQGGEKVGRDNWKKGLLVRETIESLLRHTFALLAGEDNDQESKQPHIGHILSNAMFISYMLQNRPDMDNRREKEEPKGGVLDHLAAVQSAFDGYFNSLSKRSEWSQNANIGRSYPKGECRPKRLEIVSNKIADRLAGEERVEGNQITRMVYGRWGDFKFSDGKWREIIWEPHVA